jgi:hypothetical protein
LLDDRRIRSGSVYPYSVLTDPDPGGSKTYGMFGSYGPGFGSGSRSATLHGKRVCRQLLRMMIVYIEKEKVISRLFTGNLAPQPHSPNSLFCYVANMMITPPPLSQKDQLYLILANVKRNFPGQPTGYKLKIYFVSRVHLCSLIQYDSGLFLLLSEPHS